MKGKNGLVLPSLDQLEMELEREIYRQKYRRMVRSTLGMLTVAAAAAVLIATLLLPVLRIYGASMESVLFMFFYFLPKSAGISPHSLVSHFRIRVV